jgi:hypothetical protein
VLRRATLEKLATPKVPLEEALTLAREKRVSRAAALKSEHLHRWTLRRREEMRGWLEKKDATARATAREEEALEKERKRYAREVNSYVFAKARKEMDVFLTSRVAKFQNAERRANDASSFGARHR